MRRSAVLEGPEKLNVGITGWLRVTGRSRGCSFGMFHLPRVNLQPCE